MTLFDIFSTALGAFGVLLTIGIFVIQKRLSDRQGDLAATQVALSQDLGELELREKLGPIQSRLIQLRIDSARLASHSSELGGVLELLTVKLVQPQHILFTPRISSAIAGIESTASSGEYQSTIIDLQGESDLRQDLKRLDSNIEARQKQCAGDPALQGECDKCQTQIRDLIEAAEHLAQDSVYLLTDCRAVEAVYQHATDDTKNELRALLSEFWEAPLGRLPAPRTYRGGRFSKTSLRDTLLTEAPAICHSARVA